MVRILFVAGGSSGLLHCIKEPGDAQSQGVVIQVSPFAINEHTSKNPLETRTNETRIIPTKYAITARGRNALLDKGHEHNQPGEVRIQQWKNSRYRGDMDGMQ